jgi:hypothetical protein
VSIKVTCKACGTKFKARDEWLGKRAKCTYCGRIFVIKRAGGAGHTDGRMKSAKKTSADGKKSLPPLTLKSDPPAEAPPATIEIHAPIESRPKTSAPKKPIPQPAGDEDMLCTLCGGVALTLGAIDEADGKRRRAASLGQGEYSYSFYKALCEKQGYRCGNCGQLFCEKCLAASSTRKTNVESIVCQACGGNLVILR